MNGVALDREGMMFVGEKGKILADYHCENPVLIPESAMNAYMQGKPVQKNKTDFNSDVWIDAFRNKTQSPGSFINAGPITETINLASVALRAGKRVEYDSANMKITNIPEANKFLTREYRKGWEL
jgi:hypothetical protein